MYSIKVCPVTDIYGLNFFIGTVYTGISYLNIKLILIWSQIKSNWIQSNQGICANTRPYLVNTTLQRTSLSNKPVFIFL